MTDHLLTRWDHAELAILPDFSRATRYDHDVRTAPVPGNVDRSGEIRLRIEKAIVTAAGPNQGRLPLQRFVDSDGIEKPALRVIVEEVFSAPIQELVIVVQPGSVREFSDAVGREFLSRIVFIEQTNPKGYTDALLRAESVVGASRFLHLVGDHLYISGDSGRSCVQQLIEAATAEDCAVSAVQATSERLLSHYGVVGGQRVSGSRLVDIERVIEKPTPTVAEQELLVPGVRTGKYLCFFGMHVLPPSVFTISRELIERNGGNHSTLSQVLNELAVRERYLGIELVGTRYDLGIPYGTLTTQLALALAGVDRESVLSQIVELLATHRPSRDAVTRSD